MRQFPAIPLITHDPYFSYWLMGDELHEDRTRHWTQKQASMHGLIRIDGEVFVFMGKITPALSKIPQTSLEVTPTCSLFRFETLGVQLVVEFLSPLLLDDIDLCARPATYVTFTVTSATPRKVEIYFDATGELAVDNGSQEVEWSRHRLPGIEAIRIGSREQRFLNRSGDNLRIDWGYLYLAASSEFVSTSVGGVEACQKQFAAHGDLPVRDDMRMPRRAGDETPGLISVFDCGIVHDLPIARHLTLAYDDVFSVEFLDRKLRPYWRHSGQDAGDLLLECERTYDDVREKCVDFDERLLKLLLERGGEDYALLGAICYRQAIAAHKIVCDFDGTVMMFSKENASNGCIATVDVTYPSSPLFLLLNPSMLEAQLLPVLEYAMSNRWNFSYAPHDLGTYPLGNGQVYGGGERSDRDQMPVEECGNMLILLAAHAEFADTLELVEKYWALAECWSGYLGDKGETPERQLCTDDFTKRLANNANLSIKAILGIAAFAQLCQKTGRLEEASAQRQIAQTMAEEWMAMAAEADHTKLAFDIPGTWSLKYNLVWDRLLGLDLFPAELAHEEFQYYLTQVKTYGIPLDVRADLTKLDWQVWVAAFAETRDEFKQVVEPIVRWLAETPNRVPVTDLYWTDDGRQVSHDSSKRVHEEKFNGFQARSVVGGIFLPLLQPKKASSEPSKGDAAKAGKFHEH